MAASLFAAVSTPVGRSLLRLHAMDVIPDRPATQEELHAALYDNAGVPIPMDADVFVGKCTMAISGYVDLPVFAARPTTVGGIALRYLDPNGQSFVIGYQQINEPFDMPDIATKVFCRFAILIGTQGE